MDSPILEGDLLEPVHRRQQLSSSPNQDAPPRSPFQAPNSPHDSNSIFGGNSPWSGSQDSLTLAPINPNSRFDNLPLPTWSQNPNPFANLSQDEDDLIPPPSNQAARRQPRRSEYRIDTESPDPFDFLDLPDSPPPAPAVEEPTMPAKRRRPAIDLTDSSPPPSNKRKATSPGKGRASKVARPDSSSSASGAQTPVDIVDLSNVEDTASYEAQRVQAQAEAIRAQNAAEASKPVKLAEFQCIICMDNPTDLTVTHCGHLFCSECLHQALHAGEKKCCPVCRTNIQPPRNGKQGKQGVFALEMKLLTSKKKGKQAVR